MEKLHLLLILTIMSVITMSSCNRGEQTEEKRDILSNTTWCSRKTIPVHFNQGKPTEFVEYRRAAVVSFFDLGYCSMTLAPVLSAYFSNGNDITAFMGYYDEDFEQRTYTVKGDSVLIGGHNSKIVGDSILFDMGELARVNRYVYLHKATQEELKELE